VVVTQGEIVDVPPAPDELAVGVRGRRGCAEALLDGLPVRRVVEVPGFVEHAGGVVLADGAEAAGVVLVLLDGVGAVGEFDEAVPGVVRAGVGAGGVGGFGDRGHVAGFVVGRVGPGGAGGFGD